MKAFDFGKLIATKRVWELIDTDERFNRFVGGCLSRFAANDWGDVEFEDWVHNDEAVEFGEERLIGVYRLPDYADIEGEDKLWIITEWDRSATTILFPGEY